MRAALKLVEDKIGTPSTLADEARRRLKVAANHLEKALALWRRAIEQRSQGMSWRQTRSASRLHVKRSRRQWKRAVQILQTA